MGYSWFVSGLTHLERERAFLGYTVYSNMSGDAVYLVDMDGKVAHRWAAPAGTKVFYGHLLENGNLLTNCTNGSEIGEPAGPRTAVVADLDWDSKVVWHHTDPLLHHAHCRLENGNTMLIATDILDAELSREVLSAGGGTPAPLEIWSESLWEVTPQGKVVWEWNARDHLDFEAYAIPRTEGPDAAAGGRRSREWLHLNAVEEIPGGDMIMSYNTISTLVIVDRSTGAVKWRKAPETSSQHNPTWLPQGSVLVFDNGSRRNSSRVIEIDHDKNEVTWEYTGSPRDAFFSMNVSGSQRLPNGNTLITEGRSGRLFEVTPERDIVWEYINPFECIHRGQRSRAVFRSYRYAADSPEIRNRVPAP